MGRGEGRILWGKESSTRRLISPRFPYRRAPSRTAGCTVLIFTSCMMRVWASAGIERQISIDVGGLKGSKAFSREGTPRSHFFSGPRRALFRPRPEVFRVFKYKHEPEL
jgi:hypothetical protein